MTPLQGWFPDSRIDRFARLPSFHQWLWASLSAYSRGGGCSFRPHLGSPYLHSHLIPSRLVRLQWGTMQLLSAFKLKIKQV